MGEIKEIHNHKWKNIEAVRFFFALSIVYFHLLHSYMMPYTEGTKLYSVLAEQSRYAKYIVECFFIMSGFFLYRSILAHPEQGTLDFLKKRVYRLWPVLAFSTILSVIFLKQPPAEGLLNLFFLQSTGLTLGWKGLNWYVSAFFFAELFYFLLYQAMKNSAGMKLLIGILVYFGYALNITATGGGFGRTVVYGVFSLAMARGIAGIGMGYLLGFFYDALAERKKPDSRKKKREMLLISFLEAASFGILAADFFLGKEMNQNQFLVVVCFSVFFLCMLTEKGIFSRILVTARLDKLGKYAYATYVMQRIAFLLLEKTFWLETAFLQNHAAFSLVFSLAVTQAVGIGTYYLIEQPVFWLYRKS